jgi:hypothetical protein
MANNPYVNKVALADGTTLIDLTGDTITAADLASGITAHDASGAPITGSSTKDSDTSDDTAVAGEILSGKTAHARGALLTGSMPNNGSTDYVIDDVDDELPIAAGYHDGTGKASIDATEKAKIIPGNIKEGVTILGVQGTHSGSESVTAQAKSATPTFSQQTILPDANYDYLSQVTVAPIAVVETDNSAGGKTVTIGTAA